MIYTRMPNWVRSVLAGMTMLIAGVMIGAVVLPSATGAAFDGVFNNNYQITGELIAEMERTYGDIYNRAAPAVVAISAFMEDEGQFGGATRVTRQRGATMSEIIHDMLIWLVGFLCLSVTALIVARAIANNFQKRALAKARAAACTTTTTRRSV